MTSRAVIETDRTLNQGVPFDRDAELVLRELRPALAAIVEQLSPPVRRASELQRLLSLDKKLSWSVFSAATTRDDRTLASVLPGRRAIERFFHAAAVHGVAEAAIGRARMAFARFESLVAHHAGSRDAFETMVGELRPGAHTPGGGSADLRHKRAAYRALSLLWGRQAGVFSSVKIMHPSQTPGLLDQVLIRGMVGLRRTRRSAALHMTAQRRRAAYPGDPVDPRPPEPLDPRESGPDAVGLLRDFCSQPPPRFRQVVNQQGYRCHELVSEELGPSGEVSYFIGEVMRADSAVPGTAPGAEVTLSKAVDIPLQTFSGDLLMHRSVWDTRPPEVRVYAWPLDGSMEIRETDRLPLTEHAEYLGDGIDAARTPLIPRYAELLAFAMERMGWRAEEFRVFRCRVEYPVLYSRIRMTLR